MKRVLITGAGSYIGTSFAGWVQENETDIETATIDMREDSWKNKSFKGYDTVFHVAGIAHADVGKVTEEEKALYYKVNTSLTMECAKKAKEDGVKQFIFMSSIIVYGESAGIGEKNMITSHTPLKPANFYGDSKVKAEKGILRLEDEQFHIVILRPPMIYGRGCKGNYNVLSRLAKWAIVFPNLKNQRSMLYIGNLCKFVSFLIHDEAAGVFFPQNSEYVSTTKLVKMIRKNLGKRTYLVGYFNPLIKLLGNHNSKIGKLIKKAFGNQVYSKDLSRYRRNYCIYSFADSVHLTEGKEQKGG